MGLVHNEINKEPLLKRIMNRMSKIPNLIYLNEMIHASDLAPLGRSKISYNCEVDLGRSLETLTWSLPQTIAKAT